MRSYWSYSVLLFLIFLSTAETWGETHKTVMYGIAAAGLLGLVAMKALEERNIKSKED